MITDSTRYKRIKSMMGLIIAIICIIVITVFMYTSIIDNWKATQTEIIHTIKEEKFNQIYLCYDELETESAILAKSIANDIEKDIKDNFDLKELKETLDSKGYDEKLLKIFRSHIDDVHLNGVMNSNNGAYIMSSNKIEEDLNYQRAILSSEDGDRTLVNESKYNYNKALYKDALDKIKEHSIEMIATEYEQSDNPNHIMLTEMNKNTLREVYVAEGLEGLKNYQFMVPVYITDTGDIFGQRDIVQGKLQPNHKFIVIVEFNLYDQIIEVYRDLVPELRTDSIENQFEYMLNLLYLFGIAIIVFVIIIIMFIVSIYNNFIIGYQKACYDSGISKVTDIPTEEKDNP